MVAATLRKLHFVCRLCLLLPILRFTTKAGISAEKNFALLQTKVDNNLVTIGEYSKWPALFADISLLKKKYTNGGNAEVSNIELAGTWLLYENRWYEAIDVDDINGVKLFTSTSRQSHELKDMNLTGPPRSMQPVSVFGDISRSCISFFQSSHFQGMKMFVSDAVKPQNNEPTVENLVNSVITVGPETWRVALDNQEPFCLVPNSNMTDPVCGIPNLIDGVSILDGGVLEVVRTPCASNTEKVIAMSQCWERGFHDTSHAAIQFKDIGLSGDRGDPEETEPTPTPSTTIKPECPEPVFETNSLGDEYAQLIIARLNGSIGGGESFQSISNPANMWKTELFDKSLQIFSQVCSEKLVEEEFVNVYAQMFFYHLEKVWKTGRYVNLSIPELEWITLLRDMDVCLGIVNNGTYKDIAEEIRDMFSFYVNISDLSSIVDRLLGDRPEYDYFIEISWLMANMVVSVCTHARIYDVNYLPNYLTAFQDLYFSPLETQWIFPANYTNIYKNLLGGYGMNKMLLKVKTCAYKAIKLVRLDLPYPRPVDQEVQMLIPFWDYEEPETTTVLETSTAPAKKG